MKGTVNFEDTGVWVSHKHGVGFQKDMDGPKADRLTERQLCKIDNETIHGSVPGSEWDNRNHASLHTLKLPRSLRLHGVSTSLCAKI